MSAQDNGVEVPEVKDSEQTVTDLKAQVQGTKRSAEENDVESKKLKGEENGADEEEEDEEAEGEEGEDEEEDA